MKPKSKFKADFTRKYQVKLVRLLYQNPHLVAIMRSAVKVDYFEDKLLQWALGRIYYAQEKGFTPTKGYFAKELKEAIEYGTVEKAEKSEYVTLIQNIDMKIPDAAYVQQKIGEWVRVSKLKSGLYKTAVALEEEGDTDKAMQEFRKLDSALRHEDSVAMDPSDFRRYMKKFLRHGPKNIDRKSVV